MTPKHDDSWHRSLAGITVGKYKLVEFVGAGKIGYVYRADYTEVPGIDRAVKLTFDTLKQGWENELRKVMALGLVQGVVHFYELGESRCTHNGITHLCQFTVWDYIAPGENLRDYLERVTDVETSFLLATAERILHVLQACEEKGVPRHGDLHSGNILIGDSSAATLDDSLQRRHPIFVSDFGYGATGGTILPKDDYTGLAQIINEIIPKIRYDTSTATDRQILQAVKSAVTKFLGEPAEAERRPPLDLLHLLKDIAQRAQTRDSQLLAVGSATPPGTPPSMQSEPSNVGQFQVSEMIGNKWDWWKWLFVPTVPARSKILTLNIPTVVTGPRGCGKTMLFRRLSERLVVECGEVSDVPGGAQFVAFYVNANDIADAFAQFPDEAPMGEAARLTCYANLCVLADLLAVQSARASRKKESATDALLSFVRGLLVSEPDTTLVEGENPLERYRTILEKIKWKFPLGGNHDLFPGYGDLSQHRWLPYLWERARDFCPWIGGRSVLLFIDDYTIPRITTSMQGVLNRLFLQRSEHFLAKLATEASTTFVPVDSSGKHLDDGDDYQLVDMGEESLFLPDTERSAFLSAVFSRRLESDQRIPRGDFSLLALLGRTNESKTDFARRLRRQPPTELVDHQSSITAKSQRRGRSKSRVYYSGQSVFSSLWSGDTRTMIQLITDLVADASDTGQAPGLGDQITLPIDPEVQDRVFRNRGSEWLSSHTRDEPTSKDRVKAELARIKQTDSAFALSGDYGDHLKAVVEAFVAAARNLLLGPTYRIKQGNKMREVPRMAFRLEIVDDFRIDGLAREIYRDLVRYGLFIRDSRGKSVRGSFVPRLYLRRLLLPYSTLALSKRDSVQLSCEEFILLLLRPDEFKRRYPPRFPGTEELSPQIELPFNEWFPDEHDPAYDDLGGAEDVDVGEGILDDGTPLGEAEDEP